MNNDFLQYFHTLIQYERSYHNFGFIGQKGNLSGVKRDVRKYFFFPVIRFLFFIIIYASENSMSMLL
jgi:hypothetical protein